MIDRLRELLVRTALRAATPRLHLIILAAASYPSSQTSAAHGICLRALRQHPCEFKVVMARSLGCRWQMYRETTGWRPTHLWMLLKVQGREAAGYAESALITMLQTLDLPANLNMNFKTSGKGGTGPRKPEQMHDTYFIYLAVNVHATEA